MRFEKGVDFYEFIKENVFFEEKCRLVNFYNCNNFLLCYYEEEKDLKIIRNY